MGRIDAPTGEIASVGSAGAAAAPAFAAIGPAVRGRICLLDPPATAAALEGLASEWGGAAVGAGGAGGWCWWAPPATAAALEGLASEWAGAADRLQDEIAALGHAAGASAIAYQVTDQHAMGGG